MNKKASKKKNKGFSLVELIIVIAIMAILAGVLAPQFIKYIGNSKKSSDIQNAQLIADAVSAQIAEDGANGTTTTGCTVPTAFGKLADINSVVGGTPTVKNASGYTYYYTIDSSGNVKVYVGSTAATAITDATITELVPTVASGSDWD